MEDKTDGELIEIPSALGDQAIVKNDLGHEKEKALKTVKKPTFKKVLNCTECGKAFSNTTTLKKHESIHTGEKPFSCSQCDYKCSTSGYLRVHERTHTGEKQFSCSQCDYKCSRSSNLKIHEKTHAGEKQLSC